MIELILIIFITLIIHEIGHILAALTTHTPIVRFIVGIGKCVYKRSKLMICILPLGLGLEVNDASWTRNVRIFNLSAGIIFGTLIAGACLMIAPINTFWWRVGIIGVFVNLTNLIPLWSQDGEHLLRVFNPSRAK